MNGATYGSEAHLCQEFANVRFPIGAGRLRQAASLNQMRSVVTKLLVNDGGSPGRGLARVQPGVRNLLESTHRCPHCLYPVGRTVADRKVRRLEIDAGRGPKLYFVGADHRSFLWHSYQHVLE
jgi:hypothetical protein